MVVVRGLVKTPEYNGQLGLVVGDLDESENRLPVKLVSSCKTIRVKPANLELGQGNASRPEETAIALQQLGVVNWKPGSVDPSTLPPWTGPLQPAFVSQQFSIIEQLTLANNQSLHGTDPVFNVKEALVCLASRVDSVEIGKSVFAFEDSSAKEGLIICATAAHACGGLMGADEPRPLLIVHYWSNSASDPGIADRVRRFFGSLPPGAITAKKTVTAAELAALRAMLAHNAERLAPAWTTSQARAAPPSFSVSFFTPLGGRAAAAERPDCVCGANGPRLKCRRCGLKWYCSKECQVPLFVLRSPSLNSSTPSLSTKKMVEHGRSFARCPEFLPPPPTLLPAHSLHHLPPSLLPTPPPNVPTYLPNYLFIPLPPLRAHARARARAGLPPPEGAVRA